MSERLSPAALLRSGINGLVTVVNLDPRDPRTKNFKRAAAVSIGQDNRRAEPRVDTLSRLTGNTPMDWDTKFTDDLPESLAKDTDSAIATSLEVTGRDPALATVYAVNTYVKPVLNDIDDTQASEVIRRVVTGVLGSK